MCDFKIKQALSARLDYQPLFREISQRIPELEWMVETESSSAQVRFQITNTISDQNNYCMTPETRKGWNV